MQYENEVKSILSATAGYISANFLESQIDESDYFLESTSENVTYMPGFVTAGVGTYVMTKKDGLVKSFGMGMAVSGILTIVNAYKTKNAETEGIYNFIEV